MNNPQPDTTKKFIDEYSSSFTFFLISSYVIFIAIAISSGIIIFTTQAINSENIILNSISAILYIIFLLTLFYLINWVRNHWFYKAITDNHHIQIHSIFKKQIISWSEIIKLETQDFGLTDKIAFIKTEKKNYYFLPTFKLQKSKYPILKWGILNIKWRYENGETIPITIENCPLFTEIKEKIKNGN